MRGQEQFLPPLAALAIAIGFDPIKVSADRLGAWALAHASCYRMTTNGMIAFTVSLSGPVART